MNCIFCNIVEGKIPAQVIYEDEEILAFRDVDPQAPTHILVIPRRHIPTINDLQEQDILLMGTIVHKAKQIAQTEGLEEGYRLVWNVNSDGGQAVYHIHLHILGGRKMTWPPG